jgi:hypothetical protein
MAITDWHNPYNTIDEFRAEFADKSNDFLFTIAESWKGQKPGITAALILEERKQSILQEAERKQWWARPAGILAIGVITNLLTAAVFYIIGRQG